MSGTVLIRDGYDNRVVATLGVSGPEGIGGGAGTISGLAVGVHQLTAYFQGSADYAASISETHTHEVLKAPTSTTITSSKPDSSAYGEEVTFTAQVWQRQDHHRWHNLRQTAQ